MGRDQPGRCFAGASRAAALRRQRAAHTRSVPLTGQTVVTLILEGTRTKVLVLAGHTQANGAAIDALRDRCDVVEMASIDQAIEALRHEHFTAIFSDSADFLPLERALVSQQANVILNTIGEGVCIVDGEGRSNWMNRKMQAWPARVHEKIRRTCQEAFELFSKQVSPQAADPPPNFSRSKRYALN